MSRQMRRVYLGKESTTFIFEGTYMVEHPDENCCLRLVETKIREAALAEGVYHVNLEEANIFGNMNIQSCGVFYARGPSVWADELSVELSFRDVSPEIPLGLMFLTPRSVFHLNLLWTTCSVKEFLPVTATTETKSRSGALELGLKSYIQLNRRLYAECGNGLCESFYNFHATMPAMSLNLTKDYQKIREMKSVYATGMVVPVDVRTIKLTNVGDARLRIYIPLKHRNRRCLMFCHGGGFVLGNEWSDHGLLTRICKETNSVVVSVGYPLAPENPFPAPIESVRAVLSWLRLNGPHQFGINPSSIGIMGISAGATIASIVAFKDAISKPSNRLKFQVLWAPVVKLNASRNESSRQGEYVGLTSSRAYDYQCLSIPWDCPWKDMFFEAQVLSELKLAPTYFYGPEQDCLHEEGLRYVQHLRSYRQVVELRTFPGVPHHGLNIARVSPADEILAILISEIRVAFAE